MVGHSSEADAQALGSIPIRSFTADEIRCNRGSARSSARKRAQEEIESAPVRRRGGTAEASTTSSEVVRREFADANLGGKLLDDVPDQLFRNSFAPDISGAAHAPKETTGVDSSRRCPVIHKAMHPIRNGNGCPSRCWRCPTVNAASSWRRSPQASSGPRTARSRLPSTCPQSGACQRACPCSAVNQLPSLTPSFFTPLTRRIPATKSVLRSPQSAASYARRRTEPRRRLTVPGTRLRHSRCTAYVIKNTTPLLTSRAVASLRVNRQLGEYPKHDTDHGHCLEVPFPLTSKLSYHTLPVGVLCPPAIHAAPEDPEVSGPK